VEKLIEETLQDQDHLRELLSVCEGINLTFLYLEYNNLYHALGYIFLKVILNLFIAQRQIGETNLNEMSSRSHQILRLVCSLSA
jgi:hypothetical protein